MTTAATTRVLPCVLMRAGTSRGPFFLREWLPADEIHWDETFRDGLDAAPQAFIDMLDGANTGKMLVRL